MGEQHFHACHMKCVCGFADVVPTARAERAEAAIRESLSRPDVVEAAAREQYEYWMNTASNRAPAWDREPEDTREVHREAARAALSAAFLAALDSTETVEVAPTLLAVSRDQQRHPRAENGMYVAQRPEERSEEATIHFQDDSGPTDG